MQRQLGTEAEAARFYAEQATDRLNERMRAFVARQEMFFLGTSDRTGACDTSFRAGPRGFLRTLDDRTLLYPEYRGNGVHASLGNISENPHAALLLIDFERAQIGLHINGRASVVTDEYVRTEHPEIGRDPLPGRHARVWVCVEVTEAYLHGGAHIPHLVTASNRSPRDWGSGDYRRRGGDFFGVARARAAQTGAAAQSTAPAPGPVPPTPAERPEPPVPAARKAAPAAPVPVAGSQRPESAAPADPPASPAPAVSPVMRAWRAKARRVLEEAERRGQRGGTPAGDWFGHR